MHKIKVYASLGYSGYVRGYPAAVAVPTMQEADILLLAGGADIDPEIYSHRRYIYTHTHPRRDAVELEDARYAIANGIPIVGTCRGAQLLTALAGGSLYQDVRHPSQHQVVTSDGQLLHTNSLHHQMCNLDGINHELLAWTENLSQGHHVRWETSTNQFENIDIVEQEPEVFILPEIKSLCIQSHPEMGMTEDFKIWWDNVVHNFYSKYLN